MVVVDPISSLSTVGDRADEVQAMLLRMVDFLKRSGITAIFTSLTATASASRERDRGRALLADGRLAPAAQPGGNGERNRGLYVLKSRGMDHSNQIREFLLTGTGIELLDAVPRRGGALTGAARRRQGGEVPAPRRRSVKAQWRACSCRSSSAGRELEAQIEVLRADMVSDEIELQRLVDAEADYLREQEADTQAAASGRAGVARRDI